MYHIFVDLEMQEIEPQNKIVSNYLKQEVIQIGAVVLDENMNCVDHFKSYVRPQFSSHMRGKYAKLTGITDEMILTASDFRTVLADFCNWCKGYEDVIFYEWSDCDLIQIKTECRKKGIAISEDAEMVLCHWRDLQRLYGKKLGIKQQVALETAIWTFHKDIEGRRHDAFWDAKNTATIFAMLQNDNAVNSAKQMLCYKIPRNIMTYKLGDLFDFSKLLTVVE